jgi:hypothetical protein
MLLGFVRKMSLPEPVNGGLYEQLGGFTARRTLGKH